MTNSNEINRMDISEFRSKGYLKEVNRRFFHPLGLALEVITNDDGSEVLGGVWDMRDDPEGIHYDLQNCSDEYVEPFRDARDYVNREITKRFKNRVKLFGMHNHIEPIPEKKEGDDEKR